MTKTPNTFDVCGIGNAIVDILSFCEDEFLVKNNLIKGSMTLIGQEQSHTLYRQVGPSTECSGGSVANSLAGLASLGAKTAFIGKIAADQMGEIFTHDMRAVGVQFDTEAAHGEIATANCIVLVTPDAQRTMGTFIGACSLVSEADIDPMLVEQSAVTYIEGYLWDTEHAKSAIRKAINIAKENGKKVAFTLSDTFCVSRHRDEFLRLVTNDVDILFANEAEIKSLFETDELEIAFGQVRGLAEVVAVTRSEKGSMVLTKEDMISAAAVPVAKVVDTTGAGDLYASGFLYGITQGWELQKCAVLGNKCAAQIITQLGARSMAPLNKLVA